MVLENGTRAWRRLRLACETAKRDLTAAEVANIYLPELTGLNEVVMCPDVISNQACLLSCVEVSGATCSLRTPLITAAGPARAVDADLLQCVGIPIAQH